MKKLVLIFAVVIAAIAGCIPCHHPNSNNCNNAITIDTIYTTNVVVGQSATTIIRWNDDINTSWDVTIYNPNGSVFAERINTTARTADFPNILVNKDYTLEIKGRQTTTCPPPYNSLLRIGDQGDVQKPR